MVDISIQFLDFLYVSKVCRLMPFCFQRISYLKKQRYIRVIFKLFYDFVAQIVDSKFSS